MKSKRRSGFSYIELMAAVLVISVMLAMTAQMLSLVMARTAATQRHFSALEAAASILEIVASQPYDSIDDSMLTLPAILELVEEDLAAWQVELKVSVEEKSIATKRIELRLLRASNLDARPLVLSTWKHGPE